jgi:hypothetical protein
MFFSVYGSPTLQAAVGVDARAKQPPRRATKSPLHRELIEKRIAELKARIPTGGLREALIRGLLFAGMGRAAVDERGFEAVRRIRKALSDVPLSTFKATVREQYCMLLLDGESALAAIPSMLPAETEPRLKAFDLITQVLRARGEYSADDRERLQRIGRLFGVDEPLSAEGTLAIDSLTRREIRSRESVALPLRSAVTAEAPRNAEGRRR